MDLPPGGFGVVGIPDSVEVITGGVGWCDGRGRVLQFGRESRLGEMDIRQPLKTFGLPPVMGNKVFVRVTEGILRRFRGRLEGR
jgi:hypothetical protein